MAAPDMTVSRLGAINLATNDYTALFLKLFAGEVLTNFEMNTIVLDKHNVRTISSGKSISFPALGSIVADYHTPGTYLTGTQVHHNERIITVDALLLASAFIADIDDAMNHFDARSPYSVEMGRQLAYAFDLNVFCEIILGARASAHVHDGSAGTTISDVNLGSATLATKANAMGLALYSAAQSLDEKNAPPERYAAFKPAEYYALVQAVQSNAFSAIHRDYGGNGSYASGDIVSVAGIQILKTNNLPITDLSAKTYHAVNASTTKGVVWTRDAVATVKLLDLSMQSEWQIETQGTLMVARYAMGHGYLRPECCVELRTAAP